MKTLRSIVAIGVLGAWAAGGGACSSSEGAKGPGDMGQQQPWSPPTRLSAPEHLPGPARDMLKQRMARHATDMRDLVWASVNVDYERTAELAGRIAADVDLARPLTQDATELNALIPARFFDLQDQLRKRAGELALAARRKDAQAVSQAYGAVSETCVGCHEVYRDGPPPR